MIGSGGIGCELLKNLVLIGFLNIQIIDLDTIDVSNLNRQFLFRPHHVNRSKAEVAKEAILAIAPSNINIIASHGNIKDKQYGLEFFDSFDLVINALDNVSARKHVNRLCLAADKPLIEAGTQGYLGQAFVIKKQVTECFECQPKPVQKQFPICTIRSTPDKPVHCVVFAKELHKLLLGDAKTSYLYEDNSITEMEPSETTTMGPESVYMHYVEDRPTVPTDKHTAEVWARNIFKAIFYDEILKRLEIAPDVYKTAAHPPKPLNLSEIEHEDISTTSSTTTPTTGLRDQRILSLKESAALFISSLVGYLTDPSLAVSMGTLEFSKDNPRDLDLVTACTNLRAYTFTIPMQSRFDVKSIAGNIIPAIATTNAIVAGLEVLEAIKILAGKDILNECKYTFVDRIPNKQRKTLLYPVKLQPPNKNCYVCGTQGVTVFLDTHTTTLREFIDKILKTTLNFNEPYINNGESFEFLEAREDYEDDDEYELKCSFLNVPLSSLVGGGIKDGTMASISDFSQQKDITLTIRHRDKSLFNELKHPQFFELVGDYDAERVEEALNTESKKQEEEKLAATNNNSSSSVTSSTVTTTATVGVKRHRDEPSANTTEIILLESEDEHTVTTTTSVTKSTTVDDNCGCKKPKADNTSSTDADVILIDDSD